MTFFSGHLCLGGRYLGSVSSDWVGAAFGPWWNLFDIVVGGGSFVTTLIVRFGSSGFATQQLQNFPGQHSVQVGATDEQSQQTVQNSHVCSTLVSY